MKTPIFFFGSVIAAGLAASFFLDERKGSKRRKVFKKKANLAFDQAKGAFRDYSRQLEPHLTKYTDQIKERAGELSTQGREEVAQLAHNGWSPSARLLGATASAIAFYGAGRSGPVGSMMRTVALGLFTKALLASK